MSSVTDTKKLIVMKDLEGNPCDTSKVSQLLAMNDPIKELMSIISIENFSLRMTKFKLWVSKYVEIVENTQLTVGNKKLNSEHHDFICEKVVHDCVDQLIENECVDFLIDGSSYTAKLIVLKNFKNKLDK